MVEGKVEGFEFTFHATVSLTHMGQDNLVYNLGSVSKYDKYVKNLFNMAFTSVIYCHKNPKFEPILKCVSMKYTWYTFSI
jgi:hypothetical protein